MANEIAAVVQNVGKCYHVYEKNIDRLKQALILGKRKLYREFWALRDISFEVEKGETIGIIGANGSGKSTLLQLMFGVLQPTTGHCKVYGRVGGLLELGAGFNPEETGRSNVLINASILGVKPAEMPAFVRQDRRLCRHRGFPGSTHQGVFIGHGGSARFCPANQRAIRCADHRRSPVRGR